MKLINWECLEEMDKLIEQWIKVDAIITDPPFNLVEKCWGSIHLFRQNEKDWNDVYTKDSMSYDVWFNQTEWISKAMKLLKKWGNIIIFNDWENMAEIAWELRENKANVKSLNHWQKTNPQPAEWKRRFVPWREYFLHAIKKWDKYTFNLDKIHHWDFIMWLTPWREKKHWKHPNQKPIKLMEELIKIVTNEWDTILDCFMWSNSTWVACKNLNRKIIGIELDENYFKLANDRINND